MTKDSYHTLGLLIEKYAAVSISKRNAQNKLPIELLWESNAVEDRESVGYTESIFRLMKAYPEIFMAYNTKLKRLDATQVDKKRKFCDGDEE